MQLGQEAREHRIIHAIPLCALKMSYLKLTRKSYSRRKIAVILNSIFSSLILDKELISIRTKLICSKYNLLVKFYSFRATKVDSLSFAKKVGQPCILSIKKLVVLFGGDHLTKYTLYTK